MPIRPADPEFARFRTVTRISVLDQQGRVVDGKPRVAPTPEAQPKGADAEARRPRDGFAPRLDQTLEDERPDESTAYARQGRRGWLKRMLERVDELFAGPAGTSPTVLDAEAVGEGAAAGPSASDHASATESATESSEDLWQRFNRWPSRIIAAYAGTDEAPEPSFTAIL